MHHWQEYRDERDIPEDVAPPTHLCCPKCGEFILGRPGIRELTPVPRILGYMGFRGVVVKYCDNKFHYYLDDNGPPSWWKNLKTWIVGIKNSLKGVDKVD